MTKKATCIFNDAKLESPISKINIYQITSKIILYYVSRRETINRILLYKKHHKYKFIVISV